MADIKEMVKKLLALGTSPNENEARAAILKAKELMAKYKLSEKDFDEKSTLVHLTCEDVKWTTDSGEIWMTTLCGILAENYLCVASWITPHGSRTHTLVLTGMKNDVDICKAVIDYAVGYVRGNIKHLQRKQKGNGKSIARSYAEGFNKGLGLWFDLQKDQHPEWGLVMVKSDEIRNYQEKLSSRSVKVAKPSMDMVAYMKGQNDGMEFNSRKVIGSAN